MMAMPQINNQNNPGGNNNLGKVFLKNALLTSKKNLEDEMESLFNIIGQNDATPEQNVEIQMILREIDHIHTMINNFF